MKKTTFTIFLICLLACYTLANAQTAYVDAVKLKAMLVQHGVDAHGQPKYKFDGNQYTAMYQILKPYSFDPATGKPGADDQAIYNSIIGGTLVNPFLVNYFNAAGMGNANPISSLLSGVGGLNGTNVFDGVAQFLIERGKDEVNEAFFVRLQGFLAKYPEFATLFPNTNIFLSNSNTWEYANLLNTLREAFNKDLKQLPGDIVKLKDIPLANCPNSSKTTSDSYKNCVKRITAIKAFFATNDGVLLLSACTLADGIIQNKKVPDVIDNMTQPGLLLSFNVLDTGNNVDVNKTDDLHNALQLIDILSLSLKSADIGKSYVTTNEIAQLSVDPVLSNLYFGLVFQQIAIANGGKGITFHGTPNLVVTSLLQPATTSGFLSYISGLIGQAKNLQTAVDQIKADQLAAKADLSPDYSSLISSIQQVLQAAQNTGVINNQLTPDAAIASYYTYTNQTLQVSNDIFVKNYNAAVMGMLNLIEQVVQADPNAGPDIKNFCASFLKYASFAANVVEAKTPADVKSALDAAALPVGSYTVKQKSAFNISLNAYVGYGWDFSKPLFKNSYAHGINAPIGFSFNFGSDRSWGGVPITFFASVIDLGSFVSYNLQQSNTDKLKQEVRLESVFAPSLQLFFEIPKTPLAFGAGWRQTPKLFYSGSDNTFEPIKSQSVINLSVLIDIPLFTLHNSPFESTKN